MQRVRLIQHLKVTTTTLRDIKMTMSLNGMEDLFNNVKKLTLTIKEVCPLVSQPEFFSCLPSNLESLSINFNKTFNKDEVKAYSNLVLIAL